MSDKRSKITKNIRDLRKAHGETQKELGRAINVEENTISMYESGKRQPDMQIIQAIATHYGFSLDRLMDDDFSQMDFKMASMTWDNRSNPVGKELGVNKSNNPRRYHPEGGYTA